MNKQDSPHIKDLVFEISNNCPNECLFCSSKASPDGDEIIDFKLFKKTIDSIIEKFGVEKISLSGGEPLLHENIMEMVDYCKKRALNTTIYTSGIGKRKKIDIDSVLKFENISLPKDYPDDKKKIIIDRFRESLSKENELPFSHLDYQIFDSLKKIGLDKIVFDFQCENQETYNKLMGCDRGFLYMLQSLNFAENVGLPIEFHFIPLKTNISQFKDIVEYAEIGKEYRESMDLLKIHILKFVPQGRGMDNKDELILSEEELKSFLEYAKEIKTQVPITIGTSLLSDNLYKCSAGMDKLVIRYDGLVLPCPAFKEADNEFLNQKGLILGNIRNEGSNIKLMKGPRKKPLCDSIN